MMLLIFTSSHASAPMFKLTTIGKSSQGWRLMPTCHLCYLHLATKFATYMNNAAFAHERESVSAVSGSATFHHNYLNRFLYFKAAISPDMTLQGGRS